MISDNRKHVISDELSKPIDVCPPEQCEGSQITNEMDAFSAITVAAASLLMAVNCIIYLRFLLRGRDVMNGYGKKNLAVLYTVFLVMAGLVAAGIIMLVRHFCHPVAGLLMLTFSILVFLFLMLLRRLTRNLKESSLELSELLVGMIETRDPNLNGHSRYVMNIVSLFYDSLPDQIKGDISRVSLEYAALMHNIGNIGVPESILSKNEKLSLEEWIIMYQHPRISVQLLNRIRGFDEVKDWILYHHERVDGEGYYKLKDGQIPLASKILAIADTYAALTSRRSFRGAKSYDQAMKTIRSVAGTQLDEQLVEYFCRLTQDKLKECRPGILELF